MRKSSIAQMPLPVRKPEQSVWTPQPVSRPGAQGYAMLAIHATWTADRRDLLYYEVDGYRREWHRRGTPMFATRAACVGHIKEQGHPIG